ncbi:hypothetical protein J7L09_00195, partial [bacterium]|nr:hypothetical protein [bacterium]
MKILAIETSCDDTCVALAQAKGNNFSILREIISSQAEVHKKWGGVFPSLAKREHQKNIVPILKDVLDQPRLNKKTLISQNKLRILKKILERDKELEKRLIPFLQKSKIPNLDLIAVTQGPGLEPCLWVGVNAAKALSFFWNVPLIGINHIEAHIFVNFLIDNRLTCPEFVEGTCPEPIEGSIINNYLPAICLVVSGGHTQLALMKGLFKYKILGETRDDAAGEAFDKIARILGLPYPGGPAISAEAEKLSIINSQLSIKLPRPMIHSKDYDFSFSGLKTAVLYDFKKRPKTIQKSKEYKIMMAKETQEAIVEVLVSKTLRAAKEFKAKSIILGGGVT